jgi:hypothetical protein
MLTVLVVLRSGGEEQWAGGLRLGLLLLVVLLDECVQAQDGQPRG